MGGGKRGVVGRVGLGVWEDELGKPVDEKLSEVEEAGELVGDTEPEGDLVLEVRMTSARAWSTSCQRARRW